MAKATITLTNGTKVVVEGTPEEVQQLLEFYSGGEAEKPAKKVATKKSAKKTVKKPKADSGADAPNLSKIITMIKTCDEAESIEENILDQTSVVNRTLLPLYIVHEYMGNDMALTSGDVNKITTDLGIPVGTPHASTALSKTASRYVIGDAVRKKGRVIRYKLSRRGVQYMKSVIAGKANEE